MQERYSNVYILLPVHNRRAITEKFIDCLVAQTYSNYHLILIDDGSSDSTDEMVRAKVSKLTVIRGQGDWWWAGSLQQGVDWLKRNGVEDQDVVVFMNDDVIFERDFFQTALRILDQQVGMLLPQVLNKKTGLVEETGVEADLKKLTFRPATSPDAINCLPTRGLFMRMSELRKVGDFYPRLLPHYLSDYEFTIRASRMGVHLMTSPKLLISFDEEATGFRDFEGLSIVEFVRRFFSIKSASNPVYWTTFILLTSPRLFMPWNILRIWLGAVKAILGQVMRTCFIQRKHVACVPPKK
jgi:GT2 family glycosyltransferase